MEGGKKIIDFPLEVSESRSDYSNPINSVEIKARFTAREIASILSCNKLNDGNRRTFEKALMKYLTNKQISEDQEEEGVINLEKVEGLVNEVFNDEDHKPLV